MFYFDKGIVHKLCFVYVSYAGELAFMTSGGVCVCIVVAQLLSLTQLCDPMDCSTPGSSVLHYLLEFAQILVH